MALLGPVLLSRFAQNIVVQSGSFAGEVQLAWFYTGIELTNEGSESQPLLLSYANIVDSSAINSSGTVDKHVNAFPSTFEVTILTPTTAEDRVSVKWLIRRI